MDPSTATRGGLRVALLLAVDGDRRAVERHAEREVAHLRAALGPRVVGVAVTLPARHEPLPDVGTDAWTAFGAVLEIDLVDGADGADDGAGDADLEHALAGLGDRHEGAVDLGRSAVVVGRAHELRSPTGPAPDPTHLTVVVAVRGTPGLAVADVHAGWLEVGKVNARNHPSCVRYAQLHADVGRTGRAARAAGLDGGPYVGVAVEVFPSADALRAGHAYAHSPGSLDGSSLVGEHLMDLLGRYLDFGTAAMFLGEPDAVPPPSTGLDDRQAIVDLLNRFAAVLDGRRWDRLGEVFTDESVAYRGESVGLHDIEQEIRSHLGGCGPSQHLLGNYQVRVDGDRATSVTKARVLHQGLGERSDLTFECLGDYHDDHVRTPSGWRIARRRFEVHLALGDPSVLQPG